VGSRVWLRRFATWETEAGGSRKLPKWSMEKESGRRGREKGVEDVVVGCLESGVTVACNEAADTLFWVEHPKFFSTLFGLT